MPDREKVIEELEDSRRLLAPQINAKYHRNRLELMIKGIEDALDLLKEQEAEWIYGEDETGADGWHCSYCGFFEPWFYEFTDDIDFIRFYSFCPSCRRRMTSYTGKPTQEGGE